MASSPREFFENDVARKVQARSEVFRKIHAVYQFRVTGEAGGDWIVDLIECEVREGCDENARCTVTVLDDDFMKVISGEVSPQMAFMSGRLKVDGDMTLGMKLTEILS